MTERAYATQLYTLAVQIEALEGQRDDLIIQRHTLSQSVLGGFDPEEEDSPPTVPLPVPTPVYGDGTLIVTDYGAATHFDVEVDLPSPDSARSLRGFSHEVIPLLERYPRAISYRVRGYFRSPDGQPERWSEWSTTQTLPVLVKVVNETGAPVFLFNSTLMSDPALVDGQDFEVGDYVAAAGWGDGDDHNGVTLSRTGTEPVDHTVKLTIVDGTIIASPLVA